MDSEIIKPKMAKNSVCKAHIFDGRSQDAIFGQNPKPEVKAMISSILAGYTWDEQNSTVKNARSRFVTAAQVCC